MACSSTVAGGSSTFFIVFLSTKSFCTILYTRRLSCCHYSALKAYNFFTCSLRLGFRKYQICDLDFSFSYVPPLSVNCPTYSPPLVVLFGSSHFDRILMSSHLCCKSNRSRLNLSATVERDEAAIFKAFVTSCKWHLFVKLAVQLCAGTKVLVNYGI